MRNKDGTIYYSKKILETCSEIVHQQSNKWIFITSLENTPLSEIQTGSIDFKTNSGRPVLLVPLVQPDFSERCKMFKKWFDYIDDPKNSSSISKYQLKLLLVYCGSHFRTLAFLFDILSTNIKTSNFQKILMNLENNTFLKNYNKVEFFF